MGLRSSKTRDLRCLACGLDRQGRTPQVGGLGAGEQQDRRPRELLKRTGHILPNAARRLEETANDWGGELPVRRPGSTAGGSSRG